MTYLLPEGIQRGDSRRLEVSDVTCNHGQTVFQRRCGDEQIRTLMSNGRR